ncbi:MAG: NUDIX hydrolase [Flavobacteriales bacterium]|nr:NUDIX hydrolase [Flavobacteriales bacterium]
MNENPWKTLSSKIEYSNPWIEVTEHQVIDPSGQNGIYGTVHFRNIAIGIIPMDEDQNIWLVGQYRYPLKAYSWEIPEGGGDPDIDPVISAQRELEEETGLSALHWENILEMDLSNSATDERAIVYLATELSQGQAHPESTEDLKVKKVPFEQAYEMVLNGEIRDSMSVAGLLRLKILLSASSY